MVCETVPEAGLALILDDGRRVDDDYALYDALDLGEEDAAGGRVVSGWRVFRVPESTKPEVLAVAPFGEEKEYQIRLPESADGFLSNQAWFELDGGGRVRSLPGLRRQLSEQGYDVAIAQQLETDDSAALVVEICTESSLYFDKDDALSDHSDLILNVLRVSRNFRRGGEHLMINVSDCGAFSPEVLFFFPSDDLRAWQGGNLSESALLGRALITLD